MMVFEWAKLETLHFFGGIIDCDIESLANIIFNLSFNYINIYT